EQEEAAENLLILLAMLLALVTALVIGVGLALRQALRPVSQILDGLGQLGRRNYAMRLGASPIDEIQVVNLAVNQLAESLKELESSRRTLSMKVLSLQEEERVRLARELHDELGQKLTVIRLNTGYLQKASGLNAEGRGALSDIAQATASIQQEVRELLHRLRPQ
ncbi:histidine kinase, partial [Salmonella enterica]|uniref:histidine kinase n=1 Tax=Salmonella enterica TaxID=28901 RepID=UPI003FA6B092